MAKKAGDKKEWTRAELKRLKPICEDMYVNKGYTLTQLASEWEVSEQTLVKWKKGEAGEKSWDEKRSFVMLTPLKLKELLLNEALTISEGKESTFNADKLSKIIAAIDRIDKRINPRIVIHVLKDFDKWMSDIDPAMCVEFLRYHKMYIQEVISREQ